MHPVFNSTSNWQEMEVWSKQKCSQCLKNVSRIANMQTWWPIKVFRDDKTWHNALDDNDNHQPLPAGTETSSIPSRTFFVSLKSQWLNKSA